MGSNSKTRHFPRAFGEAQELHAAHFLQSKGLKLLSTNYLCRLGEIDLIMIDGKQLVFIEVRYRKSATHGSAAESVTTTKQKRIIRAAQHYLSSKGIDQQYSCRFDVIALSPARTDDSLSIQWIPAAFDAQ